MLQAPPPFKLRGHLGHYGTGLLGAYHVTDLPLVASGSCLYLFDPSGGVLGDGRGGKSGAPSGKQYSLKGDDTEQAICQLCASATNPPSSANCELERVLHGCLLPDPAAGV